MMTQSLNKQSVDDVALTLARRKVALRHGLSKPMTKAADFDWANASKNIGKWWGEQKPLTQNTMIGAGVGGTLGLGSSLFRRDKKRPFRDALTGALAGGAVGAGYSAMKDPESIADLFMGELSEADKDEQIKTREDAIKSESLESGAASTWLNDPLGKAYQFATSGEDKPPLSKAHKLLLGGEGAFGAEVGGGAIAAAFGQNAGTGAMKQIAGLLGEQMGAIEGGKKAIAANETRIGQILNKLDDSGTLLKMFQDPSQIKNLSKPVTVMGGVSGPKTINPKDIIKALKLGGVSGTYRPMGLTQWLRQTLLDKVPDPTSGTPATMKPSWARRLDKKVPRQTAPVIPKWARKNPRQALAGGAFAAALYALLRTGAISRWDFNVELEKHNARIAAGNAQSP